MSTPIAGEDQQPGSGRIVVGVDGSPASEEALRWALGQSRLTGQSVHAVYAWDYPMYSGAGGVDMVDGFDWEGDSAVILQNAVSRVLKDADVESVVQHVLRGHAAGLLLEAAADADLLVVGSHGHGGFLGMLLGSVSQHVVAHAPCPVVVLHAPAAAPQRSGSAP